MINTMKMKVEDRDKEIDRLKNGLHSQPGGSIMFNGTKDTKDPGNEHSLQMSLKAAQLQLNILQMRNIELEGKLQQSCRK